MRLEAIEALASEFLRLDEQRLDLEKKCRELKKSMESLRGELENFVGVAEQCNIPMVVTVGNYCITQTKKHREVKAYEYDYVEFRVIEVPTKPSLSNLGAPPSFHRNT
jgi:hypothetical protein